MPKNQLEKDCAGGLLRWLEPWHPGSLGAGTVAVAVQEAKDEGYAAVWLCHPRVKKRAWAAVNEELITAVPADDYRDLFSEAGLCGGVLIYEGAPRQASFVMFLNCFLPNSGDQERFLRRWRLYQPSKWLDIDQFPLFYLASKPPPPVASAMDLPFAEPLETRRVAWSSGRSARPKRAKP